MTHTYSFYFNDTSGYLDQQCAVANNLYNQALYIIKQQYELNGTHISYPTMDKLMKTVPNLEGTINYRLLKSKVTQQVLILLDKNYQSYFKSIQDYRKNPSKYKSQPKPPEFKKKGELDNLIYTNQACRIKDGLLFLSERGLVFSIPIPPYKGKDFKDFNQVRVIPTKIKNRFRIQIMYEVKQEINTNLDHSEFSSIDLGINNLVTLLLPNDRPLLIDGKEIKSYNQFYNKNKARLQSIKDLQGGKKGYTKQLYQIEHNRENYINDSFHKISRFLVNLLLDKQIGNLVIGYNEGWKDSINLGVKTNQKFCNIPHRRLIDMIGYKCEMVGITLVLKEESHTSKTDHLAGEQMCHHDKYMGHRKYRGLFQSSTGTTLNADVNGALGIMRKHVTDDSYVSRIIARGFLGNPERKKLSKLHVREIEVTNRLCD